MFYKEAIDVQLEKAWIFVIDNQENSLECNIQTLCLHDREKLQS